jgi:PDDEXK-like domain of unknown function (DUF3799)
MNISEPIYGIPPEDGLYAGIPEQEYHSDRGSLSSSGARQILSSPAKFKYRQDNPEHSTAFDIGSYVHARVLGVGAEIAVIYAPDWKTKAARERRDQAYADGKTPILVDDQIQAEAMVTAVRQHPTAAALFAQGDPEQSLFWHDEATGVRLRARIDWLRPGAHRLIAVDLKTSGVSVNPQEWGSTAAKWKLYFQAAHYLTAIEQLGLDEHPAFCFINVEKEPPHLVSVTQLTEDAIELGRRQLRRAIDIYARCLETDEWPGYSTEIHVVDLPKWSYYQEEAAG